MTAPLLTPEDVAAHLRDVTPEWVTAQARAGVIPGRKVGRKWRFTQADVDAYVESLAGAHWGLTRKPRRAS